MTTKLGVAPLLLSLLLIEVTAHAADHSAVTPYVSDDVAAVAYLDLTAIDTPALLKAMRDLGALPQDQWEVASTGAVNAQRWMRELVGCGVTRVYVLLRTSDLQDLGPTWVLPLSDDADPDAVIQLVRDPSNQRVLFPREFKLVNGAVLAAMNMTQLQRLASRRAGNPREELVAALAELGECDAGLLVLGDVDSRRVLREMFPALPAPFDSIDGQMIADDLLWGGMSVDFPPEPKVSIHIATSSPQIAETLRQSAATALELTKPLIAGLSAAAPQSTGVRQTLELLKPKVEGAGVNLTLGDDDADELARVWELLSPRFAAARESAERRLRINRLKQLALAFLNYEATHKAFVEQANYDQTGQPLLSWRVHLLPYLEQQALYAEFHLDEPWDSPHNRKLIKRMPEIYSDPSGEVRLAVGAGRTRFVAPVADETLFPPRKALPGEKPLTVRDVKDGTSKTIMFLEVVPERAVVWTKPEDWDVNLEDPLQGVKATELSSFIAAFCDGHVTVISNDVDAQKLRALLTRAGGEPVDW